MLASYQDDSRIRDAAIKFYVAVLGYMCRTWKTVKPKRSGWYSTRLFELLVLRCTALERVSGMFTAYEADYRNNQTELLNGVRNFEAALQAVSIETLKQLRRGILRSAIVTIFIT